MRETLYGRNSVYECLRAERRQVFRLIVATGVQEKGTLAEALALAGPRRVPIERVPRRQLDSLTGDANHQGIVAEVSGYPYVGLDDILKRAEQRSEPPWLLLLDCLQDPQNLGTLLRTAEIVGVHGVVIPDRRAAEVTPAVSSASSGAGEHVLVARVGNLVQVMEHLKRRSIWIAGVEAVPQAQMVWRADLRGPLALVVGGEGQGMRRLVKETCDLMVALPMRGLVNSLNAAVAGSVVLYEAARQRWQVE